MARNYQWCAIDAEGDVGGTGLLGVAFYDGQNGFYLTDHEQIKEKLYEYARDCYTFIAHNAEYDMTVIFWNLLLDMHGIYYNGRFNRGEWKFNPKYPKVELWDTWNLSGGISLANLGNAIGLPKYETPQILKGIDPNRYLWTCDRHSRGECIECYAIRDTEITYQFMEQFTDTLAQWQVEPKRRLGSAAVALWRSLDRPAPVRIKKKDHIELARKAYYGGRVEAYKVGTITPCYTADVQSMYPSVMLNTPFPDPDAMLHVKYPRLESMRWDYEGCADVDVTIPPMYSPPLPLSHKGERLFPVGNVRGVWTLLELRHAMQCGCIVTRVHEVLFSSVSLYPFTTYVSVLWELRTDYKHRKDPRQLTIKLLLNNLYGRLGMSDQLKEERVYPMPSGTSSADFDGCEISVRNGRAYVKQPKKVKRPNDRDEVAPDDSGIIDKPSFFTYNDWANVLWAAQITAAARVKLHEYMLLQGNELVYCDTDSIFSRAPIQGTSEGLGMLSCDGEYESAMIAGPKLYSLTPHSGDTIYKAKGVKRELAERFLKGEEVVMQSVSKPLSMKANTNAPGQWFEIKRQRQLVPAKRPLLNPQASIDPTQWSDTLPPAMIAENEYNYDE